jgi:hypothetical protein
MNDNELKMEMLLISNYCEIIIKILSVHKNLSVNKTLFFAYLLKKSQFNFNEINRPNASIDILLKCVSQISGAYTDYCENISYIIKSIHLLLNVKKILINGSELIYCVTDYTVKDYNNKFIEKAIIESEKYSDRQFLKEVINNV